VGVFVGRQSAFDICVFLLEHVVFHGEAVVLMLELFTILVSHSLQITKHIVRPRYSLGLGDVGSVSDWDCFLLIMPSMSAARTSFNFVS